jgi:hypothetical protein
VTITAVGTPPGRCILPDRATRRPWLQRRGRAGVPSLTRGRNMHAVDSHDAEPRLIAAETFRVAEAPEGYQARPKRKPGADMGARDAGKADAPVGRA